MNGSALNIQKHNTEIPFPKYTPSFNEWIRTWYPMANIYNRYLKMDVPRDRYTRGHYNEGLSKTLIKHCGVYFPSSVQ
jgi:hypothetical protein